MAPYAVMQYRAIPGHQEVGIQGERVGGGRSKGLKKMEGDEGGRSGGGGV